MLNVGNWIDTHVQIVAYFQVTIFYFNENMRKCTFFLINCLF
jgi:hypothetical protein